MVKRLRERPTTLKGSVSTTQTGQTLIDLLSWLKESGTRGLEDGRFDFQNSNDECGGSLGGFAAKDYSIGEVLFAIPLRCLLSLSNTSGSKITALMREAAVAFGESTLVTSELLIWLFMIQELVDCGSYFGPFVRSLDPISPSPLSWPKEITAALIGTNMSTMTTSFSSVERHSQFLDETRKWALETNRDCSFISADKFNLTSLIWARGHYLARRYPGTFSSSEQPPPLSSESPQFPSEASCDGREQGMMNLGALVPLLDILNHNPEREWLTFKVVDSFLNVTCNYPIKKGSEIFSNYGSLSNEMLLYAYGFCLESNDDDAITLQLMGMASTEVGEIDPGDPTAARVAKHFGTYYIRSGGMSGVPNDLWEQLSTLIGDNREADEEEEEKEEENVGQKECSSVEAPDTHQSTDVTVTDPPSGAATASNTTDVRHEEEDANEEEEGDGEGEEECCGEDDEDEADDGSDAEAGVEIGIEECEMLRECLAKKLDSLLSTEKSASDALDNSEDPRALYVKWYRAGQIRIAKETLHSLNEAITGCDSI